MYERSPIHWAGTIANRLAITLRADAYFVRMWEKSSQAASLGLHLYPAFVRRSTASSNSARSTPTSLAVVSRKFQVISSTRWFPIVSVIQAGPAASLSTVLSTSATASIIAPKELSHASLSWLDRK